jgi:hypothetical protein
MKKIDKRLRSSTLSFNKFFASVLICDEDLHICWQGHWIQDKQLFKKVLKLHFTMFLKIPFRTEIKKNGGWRQTGEAFRNRVNNSFLMFPWFRIRFRISQSWHFFNVTLNLPNKLVITLDDTKEEAKRKKKYILSLEQSILCAMIYTINRWGTMSKTITFESLKVG